MTTLADLLPPKLVEIAEVIGLDAAMRLSAANPGIRIHVPKHAPEIHAITAAIGIEAARQLCEVYGGSDLMVPKAHAARQAVLKAQMLADLKAGDSAPTVARRYGVHQSVVYKLSAQPVAVKLDASQKSLF